MKKIGDKSSILSPITGFRTQKPFRKSQLVDEGVLEVEGEYKSRKYRIKK